MTQVHIFISGYVHSVGFRAFVKREAEKRGLTGWVRNLTDRRVEAVIQGDDRQGVEEMINLCHKGPMMAEVTSVNYHWEDVAEEFKDFEIRETFAY